ncbi:MAG: AI-2E family transporter, partial [bacterium]
LIPAALIAVTQGPVIFVYVLLLYCGAQMVETYFLTPLIQQRAVSMPPALGLVAQLLMGVLAGPLGVALAFPIAVVALVLVKKLHVERIKA